MIGQYGSSGEPTHSGTWDAWLDGYGTSHTDTLSHSVTIPSGCSTYTLSFYLHIDSSETTTSIAYDKLTVTLGSSTLATYSNLNKASGYVLRSFNVGAFAGQRFGSGQTDPGCGARHQGDAVGHLGHLATPCERSQSIWLSRPRSRVQAGV